MTAMFKQYSHFFINGILITVLAWVLQYFLYHLIGVESSLSYSAATVIATIVTMILNFFIQKKYIFRNEGMFHRYIIADLFNLLLVAIMAPVFRLIIIGFSGVSLGDKAGFIVAAFVASIPVFFIKRNWVFSAKKNKLEDAV